MLYQHMKHKHSTALKNLSKILNHILKSVHKDTMKTEKINIKQHQIQHSDITTTAHTKDNIHENHGYVVAQPTVIPKTNTTTNPLVSN